MLEHYRPIEQTDRPDLCQSRWRGAPALLLSTGRFVRQSTSGYGHFNYEFSAGDYDSEPEGITILELGDFLGQLHVLLLNNDIMLGDPDNVTMKHYTNRIYVNGNYDGVEQGTLLQPFNTVQEAAALAWDGAEIVITAGSYGGEVTVEARVRVVSRGGAAKIGTSSN